MKAETVLCAAPSPLTPADKAEFVRLDKQVRAGFDALLPTGQALGCIEDRRLWATAFKSVESYLDDCGITPDIAASCVRVARVVARVKRAGKPLPSFRQAALFAELPEDDQPSLWDGICGKARGKITTKQVEDAILEATGRPAGAAVGEIDPAMAQAILAMSKADQAEILQRHHDATVKAHSPARQVGGEAADERGDQMRRLAERLLKLAEGNDRFERAAGFIRQALEVLGEGE